MDRRRIAHQITEKQRCPEQQRQRHGKLHKQLRFGPLTGQTRHPHAQRNSRPGHRSAQRQDITPKTGLAQLTAIKNRPGNAADRQNKPCHTQPAQLFIGQQKMRRHRQPDRHGIK